MPQSSRIYPYVPPIFGGADLTLDLGADDLLADIWRNLPRPRQRIYVPTAPERQSNVSATGQSLVVGDVLVLVVAVFLLASKTTSKS